MSIAVLYYEWALYTANGIRLLTFEKERSILKDNDIYMTFDL